MKLYYSPGACSLAPHIIFCDTGLKFRLQLVDLAKHQLASGEDYYRINPRGQVPVLELDNGEKLTEGPVIAQYLAEQAGRQDLLPPCGEFSRYRVLEWQNFITSELHKSYSPLFSKDYPEEAKILTRQALRQKYQWVDQQLKGRDYLTGNNFTVADAYLFTVTRWADNVGLDLSDLEALKAYRIRVRQRAAVSQALQEEGIDS